MGIFKRKKTTEHNIISNKENQQALSISLNESDFISLKEQMQIPPGFKKTAPRFIGKVIIGDLRLDISLNIQSNISLLNFYAFVPDKNRDKSSVDSFVMSLDISELNDMSYQDFKKRIADDVASSKIPEIVTNSVVNTNFWS